MSRNRFPESIEFRLSGFEWTIRFLDIEAGDHGETDKDQKEIRIFFRNRSEQNVIETIIHEVGHAVLSDISESIFKYEPEKVYDKEENLISLTSPKIFSLLRDNPELMDFLVKRIKKLK